MSQDSNLGFLILNLMFFPLLHLETDENTYTLGAWGQI